MRPPREFSIGFVAIEVSLWSCTKLLPEVSPVFVRVQGIFGEVSPTYVSLPEISMEMRPPLSSLSGSLPSRSLFGAVPNYYRRSLQHSFVQKLLLRRSLPHTLAVQRSLWCVSFSLGFVAIEVSLWHCTELLLEVSPVFVRAEAMVGKVSPTYASRPGVSLEMHPPPEFSLRFVAIEVSLWRCTELLPEVCLVFVRTKSIDGEVSPTYASLLEVSMEMRPSLEFSLGFVSHRSLSLALYRTATGGLSSIRSCRSYCWGGLSYVC